MAGLAFVFQFFEKNSSNEFIDFGFRAVFS